MAKKSRTPGPPRKVQAPKPRRETGGLGVGRPSANVSIGLALVMLVGLVVALVLVLGGRGGGDVSAADVSKVRSAMEAAGCTFRSAPAGSRGHMSQEDQRVRYATFPPASGVHHPQPAVWDDYTHPVDPRQAVHNLEHGGVVVWYGPAISPAQRTKIDAFYDESPDGLIVSPLQDPFPGITYPKHEPLGSRIALTAWTAPESDPDKGTVYIAVCPKVDLDAFRAFRDAFRGKGPERIPVSQLRPGGR